MKRSRQRIEVNLPELDAVLDRALHEPLSDPDYQKLKTALHALADLATPARTTEKTESVLAEAGVTPSSEEEARRQETSTQARARQKWRGCFLRRGEGSLCGMPS